MPHHRPCRRARLEDGPLLPAEPAAATREAYLRAVWRFPRKIGCRSNLPRLTDPVPAPHCRGRPGRLVNIAD